MWGYQLLPRLRVPYSYIWSQSLIPKPSDWGAHINITGFSFLPLANLYTPPADLATFLAEGPPPIYIGFGSIVVHDPQALTQLIFDAVQLAGVRAIVSKGWGGVGGGDNVPDNIYLAGNVPHDWLFQRVCAVVHHGGAGTTAAGIAAGRPTVVVPFFGDQMFWGREISEAGAGPTPVPFKEMTAESLAASIEFALEPEVQEAVQAMADRIAVEEGAGETAGDFQERVGIDQMRCDICPDKLAVWTHKKTGAHLSGFAVSCLVDNGFIEPRDIKLLRHRHWYVDEGAEHPIIGVIAATSSFFTALGTAASGYRHRLKNIPSSSKQAEQTTLVQPLSSDTNRDMDQATLAANPDVDQITPSRIRDVEINRDGDQEITTESTNRTQTRDDSPNTRLRLTPTEIDNFAHKMATKSLRSGETVTDRIKRPPTLHERRKDAWKVQERGRHGKAFYITRATGRLAADVTKAGLKAPVALFYNVANGFHNYPSYRSNATEVRRRDEITGLGSGVHAAGKEFVLGFYEAFSGIVTKPYKGAKAEGGKGFGKGVMDAGLGFVYNLGACESSFPFVEPAR